MPFKLQRDEEPSAAIRRIVREQTDAALAGLADPANRGLAPTVFDVRKRCKKVRAVARLSRRPLGGDYRRINRAYRDVARILAPHRDAGALLATYDRTLAARGEAVAAEAVASVRAGLSAAIEARCPAEDEARSAIARADELLGRMAGRIDGWTVEASAWSALGPGLQETYRRGVVDYRRAQANPTARRLHGLRRQVKYTRYHLRILRPTAPSLVVPVVGRFEELGDWLGDAHDLALIEEQLRLKGAKRFGGRSALEPVVEVLARHRGDLETASLSLAARLYGEEPAAFAGRFEGYWAAWVEHGRERPSPWPAPTDAVVTVDAVVNGSAPVVGPRSAPIEADPAPVPEPADAQADPAPEPIEAGAEVEVEVKAEVEVEVEDGAGDGLDGLTVTRLRALARIHELPGRSSMNRERLIDALRERGVSAEG